MRRSQRGYVGGGGLVLIAIVVGLIAAWNMGATVEPLKWLRTRQSAATPFAGEFADRSDDTSNALSHVGIRANVSVPMSFSAVRQGFETPDAFLLVRAGQDVGLDLPRGHYSFKVSQVGQPQASAAELPLQVRTYDVDLTAAGVVVDLNRQNSGRLPFPFEAH